VLQRASDGRVCGGAGPTFWACHAVSNDASHGGAQAGLSWCSGPSAVGLVPWTGSRPSRPPHHPAGRGASKPEAALQCNSGSRRVTGRCGDPRRPTSPQGGGSSCPTSASGTGLRHGQGVQVQQRVGAHCESGLATRTATAKWSGVGAGWRQGRRGRPFGQGQASWGVKCMGWIIFRGRSCFAHSRTGTGAPTTPCTSAHSPSHSPSRDLQRFRSADVRSSLNAQRTDMTTTAFD
jgi:hypothetical protein